jgi:hypothetical protein
MNLFSRKPKQVKPPQTINAPRIDFLGEQAGPVEDDLKARFWHTFAGFPAVQRAYLARLSYGQQSGHSVGLCIRSTSGIDQTLQKRLGQIFTETFNAREHLDILFIRDDQEQELKKVCGPFYVAV